MSGAYYNEINPDAAQWLRNLIDAGWIAPGDVDERDIREVEADDLKHYTQVHLFAGIGGWSLALRLAGWPDSRRVWTGSCPCPPFSSAGKKKRCPQCSGRVIPHPRKTGIFACIDCAHEWYADERHLWPEMLRLVEHGRPPACFGEQVSGADGLIWLAGVRATLEALGYGVGGLDSCAAGVGEERWVEIVDEFTDEILWQGWAKVGPPHIRQRLWWVADATRGGHRGGSGACGQDGTQTANGGGLVHSDGGRRSARGEAAASARYGGAFVAAGGGSADGRMGDASSEGLEERAGNGRVQRRAVGTCEGEALERPSWSDFALIPCLDGKLRRISAQSGDEPLAHGLPRSLGPLRARRRELAKLAASSLKAAKRNRVIRLKGYGNAIVPEVAAEFIGAYMEIA